MLEYEEFKEAVDNGYIKGDKVWIVRRDGKIFDYVLPGEPVRPWEVVSEVELFQNLPHCILFQSIFSIRFHSLFFASISYFFYYIITHENSYVQ